MGKSADEPEESPQMRAVAERAANQLQDFEVRWKPAQQKLIDGVRGMASPNSSERRSAKGVANVENQRAFSEARKGLQEATAQAGQDVAGSKAKLGGDAIDTAQATSRGLGMASADQDVDEAYISGLTQIAALGKGEQAASNSGLMTSAQMGERQAQADAQAALEQSMAQSQALGTVAGAGLGAAASGLKGAMAPTAGGTQHSGANVGGQQVNNPSAYVAGGF